MDFMPWLIILLWASSKHQTIYWKYKGIEIVIKTKIYLGIHISLVTAIVVIYVSPGLSELSPVLQLTSY